MASQKMACPRCGKLRRVRDTRVNNPCQDCRRATFTPGPEHAIEDGYWINDRGVSRYHFYDREAV